MARIRLDFSRNLPPEIIIDILSRLPLKTILRCKCVCKSWLDLIESSEFSELHLSRSVAGIAVFQGAGRPTNPYKALEFVDEDRTGECPLYCRVLIRFNFPYFAHIHSSVNGLLFMYDRHSRGAAPHDLYICNPVTREYFELPPHPEYAFSTEIHTFGFGVSKTTGQYKVVMFFDLITLSACEIYTLGTGSWRSIDAGSPLAHEASHAGVFLNGNLHWLALDLNRDPLITCLDLETELFSTFASPPNRGVDDVCGFSAFGDSLCIFDKHLEDKDGCVVDEGIRK